MGDGGKAGPRMRLRLHPMRWRVQTPPLAEPVCHKRHEYPFMDSIHASRSFLYPFMDTTLSQMTIAPYGVSIYG